MDEQKVRSGLAAKATALVVPLSHPELRSLSTESIRTFIIKRKAYLRTLQERDQQEGTKSVPISLSFSIEQDLLEDLVDLEQFGEEVSTVSQIDDNILQKWLEGHVDAKKSTWVLSEVDKLVGRSLRIKMGEKNAGQRMLILFSDYTTLLRKNGLKWVTQDKPKVAINHIVNALKPAALQKRIKEDLEFSHSSLKKDWKGFLKHVSTRAINYAEFEDEGGVKMGTTSGSNSVKYKDTGGKPGSSSSPASSGKHTSFGKHTSGSKSKPLPDCWNTECGGQHYLKNCPNTTPEQKAELYQSKADARKQSGEQRQTRTGGLATKAFKKKTPEGRLEADFGMGVKRVALPDIGSDDNVLPASLLTALDKAGAFVPVHTLDKPLQISMAVQGEGMSMKIKRKAKLSIELKLSVGPLKLRNVLWLVSENEMDEVLLGRPLMKALGFDAIEHLEAVSDDFHNMDCSTVEPSCEGGGKLSRIILRQPENPISKPKIGRVAYGEVDDDPVVDGQLLRYSTIEEDTVAVEHALEELIKKAGDTGMSKAGVKKMRRMVSQYHDIWRVSLGAGKPARLPPMKIKLKNDAVPTRVKVRKYPPEQREFLKKFVNKLVENGHAYRNPNATWCSAPLIVPKDGPAKFRFTVDLRPVNKFTIPTAWPMPHIDLELNRVAGSKVFATFDFSHGYWQLELDKKSRDCQSFITPEGVYTPTRVLHGTTNAVAHIQASIQEMLGDLGNQMIVWLDDLLMYAKSEDQLIYNLEKFFKKCRVYNMKLQPEKCQLIATSVVWCGRVISEDGVSFDPRRAQGLKEMEVPRRGSELQQFVCALNWMRTAIPLFSTKIAPLQLMLEKVYEKAKGKRTKKAAEKIALVDIGWGKQHVEVFEECKNALENAVILAHPDETKRLCLYTDASLDFWSAMITQVPHEDMEKNHKEQRHEPLAFLSGKFSGTQGRWSIVEKEAYAIVTACERMNWLLQRSDGFSLFTDHNNLIYIFNPYGSNPGISSHTASKLLRWALKLASYRYVIEHVNGEDNVWTDLMTRWAAPVQERGISRISALFIAPISPFENEDFKWPNAKTIRESQSKYSKGRSEKWHRKADGTYKDNDGRTWIPQEDTDLQLRLCIIAHMGAAGHRGKQTTLDTIKKKVSWETMNKDVSVFCQSCIHCLATQGGNRTPRPWGEAMHADKPNELLHFDFMYMGDSETGEKYIMLMKDDLSGYVWLHKAVAADAETAVEGLISWFTTFGVVKQWVSDQGSHFKNEVMEGLRRELRVRHHFTTAYTPWANGTVERGNKEVLRATRALLSEFKMNSNQWPKVTNLVQTILNHSKSTHKGGLAPITCLTGMPADSPLLVIDAVQVAHRKTLTWIKGQQLVNIGSLRDALDQIHKQAANSMNQRRQTTRDNKQKRREVYAANFVVGDYVLVAKREFMKGEKLTLRWRGPRRVTKVLSELLYEVEDMRDNTAMVVHASRLRLYQEAKLGVTEDLLAHVVHTDQGYLVHKLTNLRYDIEEKRYEARVHWKGFETDDSTWEPLQNLIEDVPHLVRAFLNKRNDELSRKAAQTCL